MVFEPFPCCLLNHNQVDTGWVFNSFRGVWALFLGWGCIYKLIGQCPNIQGPYWALKITGQGYFKIYQSRVIFGKCLSDFSLSVSVCHYSIYLVWKTEFKSLPRAGLLTPAFKFQWYIWRSSWIRRWIGWWPLNSNANENSTLSKIFRWYASILPVQQKVKKNHFCRNQNENLGKNLFEWDLAPELRGQNYDIYSRNIAKANKTLLLLK